MTLDDRMFTAERPGAGGVKALAALAPARARGGRGGDRARSSSGSRTSTTGPRSRRSTAATSSASSPTRTCCAARSRWKESARPGARRLPRLRGAPVRRRRPDADWRAREAYLQYGFGEAVTVRAGRQRIAWGSGFAWNPTNRLEPPTQPAEHRASSSRARTRCASTSSPPRGRASSWWPRAAAPDVSDLPFAREAAGGDRRALAARARLLVRRHRRRGRGRLRRRRSQRTLRRARRRARALRRRHRRTSRPRPTAGRRCRPRATDAAVLPRGRRRPVPARRAARRSRSSTSSTARATTTTRSTPGLSPARGRSDWPRRSVPGRGARGPTRAASACGATTSTPPGRGASRAGGGRRRCARWSGLDDGGVALTPGVVLRAARRPHRSTSTPSCPWGPTTASTACLPVRAALQARVRALF